MTPTIDEHASRFDEQAPTYDEETPSQNRECRNRVIDLANPRPTDVVLDLGTGTGAVALALAPDAASVVGRDISAGMLEQARQHAEEAGIDSVTFGDGRFREPGYDGPVDIITSNFAMHHLDDDAKREAIDGLFERYEPRRFVLGDVMLFDDGDPETPMFNPAVDDPATVGRLAEAFIDAGAVITHVESITDQAGVIVADGR